MNIINFYYKYSIAVILDIIHEIFKKDGYDISKLK